MASAAPAGTAAAAPPPLGRDDRRALVIGELAFGATFADGPPLPGAAAAAASPAPSPPPARSPFAAGSSSDDWAAMLLPHGRGALDVGAARAALLAPRGGRAGAALAALRAAGFQGAALVSGCRRHGFCAALAAGARAPALPACEDPEVTQNHARLRLCCQHVTTDTHLLFTPPAVAPPAAVAQAHACLLQFDAFRLTPRELFQGLLAAVGPAVRACPRACRAPSARMGAHPPTCAPPRGARMRH